MGKHLPMHDHYETLQVHPKADEEAIRAAYARLRERYDPARLEGAADELVEIARRRRDDIERAFTILIDPERRSAYDASLADRPAVRANGSAQAVDSDGNDDDLIDYRPLPPARRQERPEGFNAQPYLPHSQAQASRRPGRATSRSGLPSWLAPVLIVAVATFAIVLATLVTTVNNMPATTDQQAAAGSQSSPTSAAAAPTPTNEEIINQFEGQIVAARQVANQVPDNPNAWLELGNALYDSVVVVQERVNNGDQSLQSIYIERLPRWLEAGDAYRKVIELQPENTVARADLAATLCFYGVGVNDQSYITQGISEAQNAVKTSPEEGRALLSLGLCFVSTDPPQTQQALEQWQKVIVLPNADPNLVAQARFLVSEYSR